MEQRGHRIQLQSAPLGAGDLIDRTVRFYRKNFWTFVLIAAPPIVVGAVFLIGWMFLARSLFDVTSSTSPDAGVYPLFVGFGSFLIWMIQLVAVFMVMGGASRNFVRHILFGEAITFMETYRNVVSRIFGLFSISLFLVFALGFFGLLVFYIGLLVGFVVAALVALAFSWVPALAGLLAFFVGLAAVIGTLWLFFLVVSRFVYVPQVMLVEGQSAFSAIGRSASLAGNNVNRVGALFIFTMVAIYVALSLFYIPLGIYGWLNGIDFFSFDAVDSLPAWYEIAGQVVNELSLILMMPVLMIGLCLLYVDERVKSEGYDIELMAAKRLGDIPSVPQSYVNPLQPAISKSTSGGNLNPNPPNRSAAEQSTEPDSSSILGLK